VGGLRVAEREGVKGGWREKERRRGGSEKVL